MVPSGCSCGQQLQDCSRILYLGYKHLRYCCRAAWAKVEEYLRHINDGAGTCWLPMSLHVQTATVCSDDLVAQVAVLLTRSPHTAIITAHYV